MAHLLHRRTRIWIALLCAVFGVWPMGPGTAMAAGDGQGRIKELQREQRRIEARIAERQNAILTIDQTLALYGARSGDLKQRYAAQVVAAYKAESRSRVVSLLSADSVREVRERIDLGAQIAAYRLRLQREMNGVAEQIVVDRERRDGLRELMLIDQARSATIQQSINRIEERARRRSTAAERSDGDLQKLLAGNQSLSGAGGMDPASENAFDTRYWWGPEGRPQNMPAGGLLSGYPVGGSGRVTKTSPALIDQYLRSKGSPMAGQGFFFVLSGQRYGIDPRLLVAIAGAESSFGQQTCGSFNAWGWACPNNPVQFTSWADGIDRVTRGLRLGYLNEGRTSVPAIHAKYAPVGAANDPTGLNNNWVNNVSKFLMEMGGNPGNIAVAGWTGGFGGGGSLSPN